MTEQVGVTTSVPMSTENYDLWIRMATDNKINASNSWNSALIEYFSDLSLLREGDSINFQKASATLDGCIKVYSSRIDSAVNDTGRLLSGLNSHKEGAQSDGVGSDDDEDDDNDDDDQQTKKSRSRRVRAGNTLLDNFSLIRLKEVEKELSVDPIFRKALSDFDEGGAKSLLSNMLKMNASGRVVFDTTTTSEEVVNGDDEKEDVQNETGENSPLVFKNTMNSTEEHIKNEVDDENDQPPQIDQELTSESRINFQRLASIFVPPSEDTRVCPSLDQLERITNEGGSAAELLDQIGQIDYNAAPMFHDNDNIDYNDYDGGPNFGNDDDDDNGPEQPNGSRTQYSLFLDGVDDTDQSGPNMTLTRLFDESFVSRVDDDDEDEEGGREIADYFDTMSRQNWRGPEHWKIGIAKQILKPSTINEDNDGEIKNAENKLLATTTAATARNLKPLDDPENLEISKKKAKFTVNFLDDEEDVDEDELFSHARQENKILLPEKERGIHPTSNTLPQDLEFTTKRLIYLNIKPSSKINSILTKRKRKLVQRNRYEDEQVADEGFFAKTYKEQDIEIQENGNEFAEFEDQGMNDFGDVHDGVGGGDDSEDDIPDIPINSQPDDNIFSRSGKKTLGALSYARVAKRVNVKLLKDNLWDELETVTLSNKRAASVLEQDDDEDKENERNECELDANGKPITTPKFHANDSDGSVTKDIKFTELVAGMTNKYNKQEKSELSTSFFFICMLHLANEHGLSIESTEDYSDLVIRR